MKALVISDDSSTIANIDECLKNYDVDSINYKWLLKALDNVEEICPDITIISAQDYPRHWKIFTQFIKSGIGNNNCKVLLYTKEAFTSEESDKANALGVYGIFNNLKADESEQSLSNILSSITGKSKASKTEAIISLEYNETKKTETAIRPCLEDCPIISVDMILSDIIPVKNNEACNDVGFYEADDKTKNTADESDFVLESVMIPSVDDILCQHKIDLITETKNEDFAPLSKENDIAIPSVDSIALSVTRSDTNIPSVDQLTYGTFVSTKKSEPERNLNTEDASSIETKKEEKIANMKENIVANNEIAAVQKNESVQTQNSNGQLIRGKSLLLRIKELYEKEQG